MVAAEGEEVQVAALLVTMESARHGGLYRFQNRCTPEPLQQSAIFIKENGTFHLHQRARKFWNRSRVSRTGASRCDAGQGWFPTSPKPGDPSTPLRAGYGAPSVLVRKEYPDLGHAPTSSTLVRFPRKNWSPSHKRPLSTQKSERLRINCSPKSSRDWTNRARTR
jgi:hypothetical protein